MKFLRLSTCRRGSRSGGWKRSTEQPCSFILERVTSKKENNGLSRKISYLVINDLIITFLSEFIERFYFIANYRSRQNGALRQIETVDYHEIQWGEICEEADTPCPGAKIS